MPLFKFFGAVNRTNPEYVRKYVVDFLKFGDTKGWNTQEKVVQTIANLPLFKETPILAPSPFLPPLDSKPQETVSLLSTLSKANSLGNEVLPSTAPNADSKKLDQLQDSKQDTKKTQASRPPLAERVKKELPKTKSSERSVKKMLFVGFTLLLGAGVAAAAYVATTIDCVAYYRHPTTFNKKLRPNESFDIVERVVCRKALSNEEFAHKLLGSTDTLPDAALHIVNLLGDEMKKDPRNLIQLLENGIWESGGKFYPDFYKNQLELLDSIPLNSSDEALNENFFDRIVKLYPGSHFSALYDKLSPNLQNNEQIAAKLIDFANDGAFILKLCEKFKDSKEVAAAAYVRDRNAYHTHFQSLFNKEIRETSETDKKAWERPALASFTQSRWPPLKFDSPSLKPDTEQ